MAQCTAHAKSGGQCKNGSIPGGFVCRFHGGGAPQVKQKARERLAALVDPSITKLSKLLRAKNDMVAIRAVENVLDRNGYKPLQQVQEVPYDHTEIEALSNLTDDELAQYISLRRKVTQPSSGGGTPETPSAESDS
jgi:hypothetical protein